MNVDNSLGMAWISSDVSSTASVNEMQNTPGGVSETSEGSIFQKMISQMLMQKNQTEETSELILNYGSQGETHGIGNLLTAFLAGGNLGKGRLLHTEKALGEIAETNQTGKDAATEENEVSLETIQDLMLGLTNVSSLLKEEKIISQAPKSGNEIVSLLEAVQSAEGDLGVLENHKYFFNSNMRNGILKETGALAEGLTETDSIQSVNSEVLNSNTKQETIFASQINGSESMAENKDGLKVVKAEEGVIPSIDKLKGDTEPVARTQSGTEYLNPLQNSASFNETLETNQPQAIAKAEPYSQIGDEILTKLEQKGPTEFAMQLEPEDLGQIDIKLKLNDGKLMIDILAASSKTQALLTSQVDKLITSMGLQNVQVESVQVSQQMNYFSQSQDSQNQGYSMSSGMDFSQKRQQEQFQQEFLKGNLFGSNNLQQSESQEISQLNQIETLRYNSHRMNYAV